MSVFDSKETHAAKAFNEPSASAAPSPNEPPFTEAGGDLVAEESPKSEAHKKRMMILGGGLAMMASAAVMLTNENVSGFFSSFFEETPSEVSAPVELASLNSPKESIETVITEDEDDGEEEDDDDNEESENLANAGSEWDDESNLPTVNTDGAGSKERAWTALQKIDEWRTMGFHDTLTLRQYFGHKKVWVRLAALEIAIKQNGLTKPEVLSVAKIMRENFRHDQMRRWLKRVQARDTETYQHMKNILKV